MSEAHLDTVLAGTKGFALALFVPLTEQVGIRPRVATDATQALTLVEAQKGLVVVEVEGEGTVRSIRELLATRKEFTVVAAVSDAQAGTHDALRALGVELARWDGTPAAVLGAVSRRLGAAAPAAPPPSVAAPAPAVSASPPAVAAPAASPPAAAAPAPAPAPAFFSDLEPAAKPKAPPPSLELEDELDVVSIDDLGPELADPPAAVSTAAAAPSPAPAASSDPGSLGWPAGGLTPADAEAALARGITGTFGGDSKLRTVTEGVVSTLSALEVAVLGGDKVQIDPGPVKRAAVMRLRVAHALAKRPAPGSGIDQAALSTMLGEIDALLSEVNALTQASPAELLPSLEAVRNALVKEAIDFSEAAQELAPAGVLEPVVAPSAPAQQRRAPAARVLTVNTQPEPVQRRSKVMTALLVLAGLAAAGYHGWRYLEASKAIVAAPTVAGAPARAVGLATPAGTKTITSKDGKPFTDAEIETFRQREELQGRRVQIVTPSMLLSAPDGRAAGSTPSPGPAVPQPPPQGVQP